MNYKISRSKFREAAEKISDNRILVIGDLILDEYLVGEVNRISPEAPVPVVWVRKENLTLGGSGNVIKNLNFLGNKTAIFGRTGRDKNADSLESLLKAENVGDSHIHIIRSAAVPTTVKSRIIASHQQICRVDREEVHKLEESEKNDVLERIFSYGTDASGIILSDYDKGFFSADMITKIVEFARSNGSFVAVDPQVSHFHYYKNVSILTPNHHEAGNHLGRKLLTDEDIEKALKEITGNLQSDSLMITRGEKGMSVYNRLTDELFNIPTVAREVFDVTGAGDTVISVYTSFKTAGMNEIESAVIANAAASIVIARLGAAAATVAEIEETLVNMELFE